MRWFAHKSRDDSIAERLFNQFVNVAVQDREKHCDVYHITPDLKAQYLSKARLYHEALVLMLLLERQSQDAAWTRVLEGFEKNVLPSSPDDEGMTKLEALRGAMRRISDLVGPAGKDQEFSWASSWFASMGHTESNPASLLAFVLEWTQYYVAVSTFLKEQP